MQVGTNVAIRIDYKINTAIIRDLDGNIITMCPKQMLRNAIAFLLNESDKANVLQFRSYRRLQGSFKEGPS